VAKYKEATFDKVPTNGFPRSLPLLLSDGSLDDSRHTSVGCTS
jgi:hypothetical protein